MRLVERLALGAATTMAVVANAQAADLPSWKGAAAAEYVKICKDGAVAGFVIPGSNACLGISGYVGAELVVGKNANAYWARASRSRATPGAVDDIGFSTRGQLNFDAVTSTAMGPLFAHMDLRADTGDRSFDWTSGPALHAGYVQWAGFTAGKHSSFYWSAP